MPAGVVADVVKRICAVAPAEVGIRDWGVMATVVFVGAPVNDRFTVFEKPLIETNVAVKLAAAPAPTDAVVGLIATLNPGGGPTIKSALAVRVTLTAAETLKVAETNSAYVASATEAVVSTLSVVGPPPAVTEVEENRAVMPGGKLSTARFTLPPKPFTPFTETE